LNNVVLKIKKNKASLKTIEEIPEKEDATQERKARMR